MARMALVTGGNRGLGLGTAERLARDGMEVLVTARDAGQAERAAERIRAHGGKARAEVLDVASEDSIAALSRRLAERDQHLSVLVNNAGVSMKGFDANVAEKTTAVNFFGALHVTEALAPAMLDHGRIVLVSSGMGEVSALSPELQRRFLDPALDRPALVALVREFVRDVREGRHAERGWPSSAYRVSKAALNALARVLARELAPRGILVNAVCPGWVRTDMGGPSAPRSLEQGVQSIVWAAELPDDGPTGGFFRDGARIPW
jgi:NAD(P)-dependent dehydrogenase (short-subunit alcohol dehydrogenase family)